MRIIAFVIIFLQLFCFVKDSTRKKDEKREQQNSLLLLLVGLDNLCDPNQGKFYFPNFENMEYFCLRTNLVYEDSKVRILIQNNLTQSQEAFRISKLDYTTIGKTFSESIYPKLAAVLGESSDVNRDGKIDIVFFGFPEYYSSGAFIAGFVDPIHLFEARGLPSNQREILFINGLELQELREIYKQEQKPDPLYSTIAHEFQHLVRLQYELKISNPKAPVPAPKSLAELSKFLDFDETWIDEGTSELASDIAGYGPQSARIGCFRGDPRYGCRGGFSGRSLFDWNGSLMNYSFAYVFMKYLYETSASDAIGKNLFLNQTVTGAFPFRGKDTLSLMNSYVNKAANYNPSLLTNNATEIFQRLYALCLGLSLGYETNSLNSEDSYIQIGNNSPIYFNTISHHYPYPSELQTFMNYPTDVLQVTGSNFELLSSRVYRVRGTRANGPYHEYAVAVVRGKNGGTDPKDFLIFNGNPTKEKFISTKNFQEEMSPFVSNPILSLPFSPQKVNIHIDYYFKQRTKYLVSKSLVKN